MIDVNDWINRVWEGDCLDFLGQCHDGSIDCVVTSPPYPQGKNTPRRGYASYGMWDTPGRRNPRAFTHNRPNEKGDTGLEIRIAAPDWLDWFLSFTPEIKRVLKPNGNFVVNIDSCCFPTRHRHWGVFSLPERMEAQGWCFVEAMIWDKPNGPPVSATTRFHHSWEFVYHFANGDRWETDLDAVRIPHAESGLTRFATMGATSKRQWRGRWDTERTEETIAKPHPGGARPKDVLRCAVGGMRWDGLGDAHFAAMPLKLAKWILLWASKPGDIVLDPFGGAATTAVAAIGLDRRPIICEVTPAAVRIATERIRRAREQHKLDFARNP